MTERLSNDSLLCSFNCIKSYNMIMEKKERKPNRLKDYDYSQNGAYFITVCTKDKKCTLSNITVGATIGRPCELRLSHIGVIVENGIKGGRPMVAPTIARIINQFKGYVTKQVGTPVWQKLYYDHIIRDDIDYMTRYQYIDENPIKWSLDKYYI